MSPQLVLTLTASCSPHGPPETTLLHPQQKINTQYKCFINCSVCTMKNNIFIEQVAVASVIKMAESNWTMYTTVFTTNSYIYRTLKDIVKKDGKSSQQHTILVLTLITGKFFVTFLIMHWLKSWKGKYICIIKSALW